MSDPYRILGIAPEAADDDSIRRAYLEGLRVYSPERDPDGFQRLRKAYEQIASHRRRVAHALFHAETPSAADLVAHALAPGPSRRPSVDTVRGALAAGLKPS